VRARGRENARRTADQRGTGLPVLAALISHLAAAARTSLPILRMALHPGVCRLTAVGYAAALYWRLGLTWTGLGWWAGCVSVDFVGRKRELSRVEGALGGHARLVLVVGDAGLAMPVNWVGAMAKRSWFRRDRTPEKRKVGGSTPTLTTSPG
jgi:hypothetical protein